MLWQYISPALVLFCIWLLLTPIKDSLTYVRLLVESKADRDRLTGLWNRIALMDALSIVVTKPLEDAISIGFIDIDDFKYVIKQRGHDVADALVEDVANLLIENTTRKDFVARYDREQFVIIYLNKDGVQAQSALESILEDIVLLHDLEHTDVKITASIGVCDIRGVHARTPKGLLQAVEEATYMAKRGGKNRVYRGDAFLEKLPPPPKWRKV